MRTVAPGQSHKDDGSLVRACRRGDSSAWELLIRRYQRLIYSVPVAYRIPAEHADEVFQRVVVKLFEKLDQLKRAESLPAWLMTTTRRECQAFVKGQRRWVAEEQAAEPAEDPPDVAQSLDAVRTEHLLALALERLDETCHRLLSSLYLEDPAPSYQQIGERLGRPVGSLGPTRTRCLNKLRKLFLELGGEEP